MSGRRDRGSKKRAARSIPQKKVQVPADGVKPPKGKTKRAGTEAEWVATLLHNERALVNDLRRELLQKEQAFLNLQVANSKLKAKNLEYEIAAKERDMEVLRKDYNITVGSTIHKDDKTGEIYYLEDEKRGTSSAKVADPAPEEDEPEELDELDEEPDSIEDEDSDAAASVEEPAVAARAAE